MKRTCESIRNTNSTDGFIAVKLQICYTFFSPVHNPDSVCSYLNMYFDMSKYKIFDVGVIDRAVLNVILPSKLP